MGRRIRALLVGVGFVTLSSAAAAHPDVGVTISFGVPVPTYAPSVGHHAVPSAYFEHPNAYRDSRPHYDDGHRVRERRAHFDRESRRKHQRAEQRHGHHHR